jgi:GT2 family glycosyltransferase
LGAVIVSYRRYDLLRGCIESLLGSTLQPSEIVVVDNESQAAELDAVAHTFPGVKTIVNAGNDGFARACNQGWRALTEDLVLFVNPDVTVDPNCLRQCVDVATTSHDVGMITCRLVRPDGRFDHACHRGLPTPFASLAYALKLNRLFPRSRRFARYTMSWLDLATDHDVEACSGAFMLVRRSVLERVGGWDERYWFYAEDLDLCLRVGKDGWRVRYLANATATHVKGASSGLHSRVRRPDRVDRARTRRLQASIIDSHSLFFRLHLEPSTGRPIAAAIRVMFAAQRLRLRLLHALMDQPRRDSGS